MISVVEDTWTPPFLSSDVLCHIHLIDLYVVDGPLLVPLPMRFILAGLLDIVGQFRMYPL